MPAAVRPFRRTLAAPGGVLDHLKSQRGSCGSASWPATTIAWPATGDRRRARR